MICQALALWASAGQNPLHAPAPGHRLYAHRAAGLWHNRSNRLTITIQNPLVYNRCNVRINTNRAHTSAFYVK
jgi:hypothetical protein